jgi:hypothetical protein
MKLIDLISIVMLIIGLFLAIIMYILIRRGNLKTETWPRVGGIGAGIFMFVGLMITSILLRPISEIVNYTVTNLFWSLAFGIVAYFGGRKLARDRKK